MNGSRVAIVLLLGVFVFLGILYKIYTHPPELTKNSKDIPTASKDGGPSNLAPSVVLIVMDMVRSDRLSMCGYGRPTSRNLIKLAGEENVVSTCDAYSPGTWTLPSHASFFTGEEVPIHGADCLLDADDKKHVSLWGDLVRPLGTNLPTLAEKMAQRGYQTVMVSGNPVVSRWAATGLDRGFQVVREAKQFGDTYDIELVANLKEALDEAGGGKPIFLFVNIADAHHPWRAVPRGPTWISARPALDNRPRVFDNPYPRFLRGMMSPQERKEFLAHARDSYDWAVFRSDGTLGAVMDVLDKRSITTGPHRLVVTSDHGEFLGEHDLLSHGIFVYEPDTRVPLLFRDSTGSRVSKFPTPVSALVSHDLTLEGALPEKPRPVRAAGYPDGLMSKLFGKKLDATTAAHWDGTEKLMYINGEYSLIDLESDPGELNPSPLADNHPLRKGFERFVKQVLETGTRSTEPSPEMIEALRKLGYVQ